MASRRMRSKNVATFASGPAVCSPASIPFRTTHVLSLSCPASRRGSINERSRCAAPVSLHKASKMKSMSSHWYESRPETNSGLAIAILPGPRRWAEPNRANAER